jgi:hypothetical protein
MEYVYHIVAIRVNETSWAHVWRLRFRYLGMGYDSTCCPVVSTPVTRSLADSSMTNHITSRIPTISTILNLAQTTASNLTTVTSHHDGWKTNALNIPQVKLNIIKMDRLA